MDQLKTALELFGLQSQIKLQRLMQYRGDFFMGLLVSFGFSAMGPVFQYLLYTRTRGYPGWDWNQILLFQGVLLLVGGLRDTGFGEVRRLIDQLMEKGEFDRLLLKPFSPLLYILTSGFSPYALGTLLVGGSAVGWAWLNSGAPLTGHAILLFLVFLGASVWLHLAATTLYCALTVRWVYTLRLDEMMDKVMNFGNYPLNIYPLALQTLFVTALPFSVAIYWPAQALLGRLDALAWVALGATVGVWLATTWLWRAQLKRYTSAGG